MTSKQQKIKLRLLCNYTDEDNLLSTRKVIALLKARSVIVCSRALIGDIALLNEYGGMGGERRQKNCTG